MVLSVAKIPITTATLLPKPKLHLNHPRHPKPFPVNIASFFHGNHRSISSNTSHDLKLHPKEENCRIIKGNSNNPFVQTFQGSCFMESDFFSTPVGIFGDKEKYKSYEVKSVKEGRYVRMDLPGIERDDVGIWLTNDVLYVRAEESREKKSEHDSDERSYDGAVLLAPGCYNTNSNEIIGLSFENGVLRMVIPKIVW